MSKTPEQLAEEYATPKFEQYDETSGYQKAKKHAFLDGYKAAQEEADSCEHILDMSKMVDVNGWISVKDRLPEIGASCLVTCHEERYTIAEYDGTKWTTLNSIAYYHPIVTHWQWLPEIPKEEK